MNPSNKKSITAAEVLMSEAEAIASAARRIDQVSIERIIQMLRDCKSKIVFSGVGKSGIVAKKISATFNSVGLTSVFLNPLDALHGDLGLVTAGDLVVVVSNSGASTEIQAMIPHLRQRGVKLIGILGKTESPIAHFCDVVLDAGVDREAGKLELVPTSSTAVATALGDSLAVVWMESVGVSKGMFALNHPGGSLGLKLTLKVSDLMIHLDQVPPISLGSKFVDVIDALTRQGIGAVWIKDDSDHQKIIGIITDGDLRRALRSTTPDLWSGLRAKDFMTKNPITVSDRMLAHDALTLMEKNGKKEISVMPVVDSNSVVLGLLRLHDLVQAGIS